MLQEVVGLTGPLTACNTATSVCVLKRLSACNSSGEEEDGDPCFPLQHPSLLSSFTYQVKEPPLLILRSLSINTPLFQGTLGWLIE